MERGRAEKYIAKKYKQKSDLGYEDCGGSYVFVCLSIIVWEERNFCPCSMAFGGDALAVAGLGIPSNKSDTHRASKRLFRSLARPL